MSIIYPDTIRLDFDWDPELKEAELALVRLEGYIANTLPPLETAKLFIIQDVAERFYQEEDPEGDTWPYWADSYAMTAEQENVGILRKSEDMFYAATDPNAYQVTPVGIFFDTSVLDTAAPYWAVHQFGELSKPTTAIGASRGAYYSGEPGGVPQRAFLGVSTTAQAAIAEVFDQWAQHGGLVFEKGGKLVEAHVFRAPTGQFVSAIS